MQISMIDNQSGESASPFQGCKIVKKLLFGTTLMKMNQKVIVDPQSIEESSLTNNLVLVTSYVDVKEIL